jgi:transposase-like protein
MFKSRYTDPEKCDIIKEHKLNGSSVREVCEKYGITVQTFYLWKRKFQVPEESVVDTIPEVHGKSPEAENKILRRLYINLSAHNYELAKFLEK